MVGKGFAIGGLGLWAARLAWVMIAAWPHGVDDSVLEAMRMDRGRGAGGRLRGWAASAGLARVHAKLGRYREAFAELASAVQKRPGSP